MERLSKIELNELNTRTDSKDLQKVLQELILRAPLNADEQKALELQRFLENTKEEYETKKAPCVKYHPFWNSIGKEQ